MHKKPFTVMTFHGSSDVRLLSFITVIYLSEEFALEVRDLGLSIDDVFRHLDGVVVVGLKLRRLSQIISGEIGAG